MNELLHILAFDIFSPLVLGVLCFLLSSVYLWKKRFNSVIAQRGPTGYFVKAANWFILGLSFTIFAFVPLEDWRAYLRISVAILLISELLYNWSYMINTWRELIKWILRKPSPPLQQR